MRTVPAATSASFIAMTFGLALLLTSSAPRATVFGCLIVIISTMHVLAVCVIRSIETNREAIERKSREDDASFDAGFEAGQLKGYTEGRRAGRPQPVVTLSDRRASGD